MNAAAALTAAPSTETYGLPETECPHLIAKLRLVPTHVLATILTEKAAA